MAIFAPQAKLPIHIVQLTVIIVVLGLSAARIFMKSSAPQPRTRSNTIALGMAAKSLIILQYELLTTHVRRLQRWKSLKAFTILNGLEIVFWAAVVFLCIQGNISVCDGVKCILSWIVVGLAILLTILAVWMFGITWIEYRTDRNVTRIALESAEDLNTRKTFSHKKIRDEDQTSSFV